MFFGAGFLAARLCSSAIASSYLPWRSRSSADENSEGEAWAEAGGADVESRASCPAQIIATSRKASRGLSTDGKDSPGRIRTQLEHKKRGSLNQTPSEEAFLRSGLEVETQR